MNRSAIMSESARRERSTASTARSHFTSKTSRLEMIYFCFSLLSLLFLTMVAFYSQSQPISAVAFGQRTKWPCLLVYCLLDHCFFLRALRNWEWQLQGKNRLFFRQITTFFQTFTTDFWITPNNWNFLLFSIAVLPTTTSSCAQCATKPSVTLEYTSAVPAWRSRQRNAEMKSSHRPRMMSMSCWGLGGFSAMMCSVGSWSLATPSAGMWQRSLPFSVFSFFSDWTPLTVSCFLYHRMIEELEQRKMFVSNIPATPAGGASTDTCKM